VLSNTSTNPPTSLYRRVFLVVTLLVLVFAACVLYLVHSEAFAHRMVVYCISNNSDMKVELAGFSGNIANGLFCDKLNIKQRHPPLQIDAIQVAVEPDFSHLLTEGKIMLGASLNRLDLVGMLDCPLASQSVPDYHAFSCLAGMPANIEIASFSIAGAGIRPYHDFPFHCEFGQISLQPEDDGQRLNAQMHASFRENMVGSGTFSGLLQQRQKRLEGRLALNLFGQQMFSEISLAQRRGCPEVSGYISSTTVDIAKISHWLIPLWQDVFPFGFDGVVDCSGSWLFNREVGFYGNLTGHCRKLRMVAQGLFITLFELNGEYRLFDGNFSFNDTGSQFVGFPASLTGRIESVLQTDRKWEMDFGCNTIDFARLAVDLPWGVRYGMALPALFGGASLSVQLRGNRPEVSARLTTAGLDIGTGFDKRSLIGSISYLLAASGPGNFAVNMTCQSHQALPPIFSRFKSAVGRLDNKLASWPAPYVWQYDLHGDDPAQLEFSGSLRAGADLQLSTSGIWHDGMGRVFVSLDQQDFVAGSIAVLDLLLAR
jgi:hypothetical protein